MDASQLPLYQCFKRVRACRIKSIEQVSGDRFLVHPAEPFLDPFEVNGGYVKNQKPEPGGWLVRYSNGWLSYSPDAAFRDGYLPLDVLQERKEALLEKLRDVELAIEAAEKGPQE